MNKERMKSLLIRDKEFLRELYQNPNYLKKKKILNAANDSQLNTLIWFLHYLSTGEIRMKNLPARKIILLKQKVESKHNLSTIISSNRTQKLLFLNKLAENFSHLLYPLFNEI
jgi:hypothetical protein